LAKDWVELTKITQGKKFTIEKVRLPENDICIEGSFSLPPLAGLSHEDQIFVMAFVRSHGSIKEMESMFGISYPTVKNRLNRIAGLLELVEIVVSSPKEDVLDRLENGDISVEEALRRLGR